MMLALLDESRAVAADAGFAPRDAFIERSRGILTAADSTFTASMLRDIENRKPIEADHIIGDLIRRGDDTGSLPENGSLLRLGYLHMKAYEARLRREPSAR